MDHVSRLHPNPPLWRQVNHVRRISVHQRSHYIFTPRCTTWVWPADFVPFSLLSTSCKSQQWLTTFISVTHLGISPRYLATLQSAALVPKSIADLSTLRVVTSTGMVLSHALFTWFYEVFPTSAHLANISGGTDLAGAFGDCTPLLPVYDSGGCQCRSLGVDVRVFDREVEGRLEGREVSEGVPGELVAIKAFPNMPVGFWGDEGGKKYFSAYFERFDSMYYLFNLSLWSLTLQFSFKSHNSFNPCINWAIAPCLSLSYFYSIAWNGTPFEKSSATSLHDFHQLH